MAVLLTAATVLIGPAPAPASDAHRWVRPVDGRIVGPFRAPATPYGPGHRGVTVAAVPGAPVRAAADGVVAFVGTVAGAVWTTIAHAGGVTTSYGYLSGPRARPGTPVRAGDVIGGIDSRGRVHFGMRRGGEYLDPTWLWRARIRLVRVSDAALLRRSPPARTRGPLIRSAAV